MRTREADLRIATIAADIQVLVPKEFPDWDHRTEAGYRELVAWIGSWENRQRIENACLAEKEPLAAELLSLAEQTIAALAYRRDRDG